MERCCVPILEELLFGDDLGFPSTLPVFGRPVGLWRPVATGGFLVERVEVACSWLLACIYVSILGYIDCSEQFTLWAH